MFQLGFFSLVSVICQASIPMSLESNAADINDFLQKFSSDNFSNLEETTTPAISVTPKEIKLLFKLARKANNVSFATSFVRYLDLTKHDFVFSLEFDDLEYFVSASETFAYKCLFSHEGKYFKNRIIHIAVRSENAQLFEDCFKHGGNPNFLPRLLQTEHAEFIKANSVCECAICLDEIKGSTLNAHACERRHLFHKDCLVKNLRHSGICPECREPISASLVKNLCENEETARSCYEHINRLFEERSEKSSKALYDIAKEFKFLDFEFMHRLIQTFPGLNIAENNSFLLRKFVSNFIFSRSQIPDLLLSLYLALGSDINALDGIILKTALVHDAEHVLAVLERNGAVVSLERIVLPGMVLSKSLVHYCVTKYREEWGNFLSSETLQKYSTIKNIVALEEQRGLSFVMNTFSNGVYDTMVAKHLRMKGVSCSTFDERDQAYAAAAIEAAESSPASEKFQIIAKMLSGKNLRIEVLPEFTVNYFKQVIAEKIHTHTSLIRVIHQKSLMEDDRKLGSYGLVSGSAVHVVGAHQKV
jgi:Ubiquitin family/Zinc finger, C3HC4 type (RING finger)